MEVEDVAGVGFTAGGTTQNEGDLTIGHCLFGEIIVNYEGVFASVAEEFTDGGTCHGGIVL